MTTYTLWEVGGYFDESPDLAGLEVLTTLYGVKSFTVSEIPETDWVAHVRRELAPVVAGRFFVYGNHDADKVPIACVVAPGFAAPALRDAAPFDLIFANILKGPLIGLAPDMANATMAGGYVILSGILNEQADEVIEVYRAAGYSLAHRDEIVEWTTLTLCKKG